MRSLRYPVPLLALVMAMAALWMVGCKVKHQADQTFRPDRVHVNVPAQGPVMLDEQAMPLDALRDHLVTALASGELLRDAPVVVIGEADTAWERLREAYGRVLAAGLRNVTIVRQGSDAP